MNTKFAYTLSAGLMLLASIPAFYIKEVAIGMAFLASAIGYVIAWKQVTRIHEAESGRQLAEDLVQAIWTQNKLAWTEAKKLADFLKEKGSLGNVMQYMNRYSNGYCAEFDDTEWIGIMWFAYDSTDLPIVAYYHPNGSFLITSEENADAIESRLRGVKFESLDYNYLEDHCYESHFNYDETAEE